MTDQLRPLIPYGYRVFTGHVMSDDAVDSYNATQERINAFISSGLPVPDYLLYDSFQRIAIYQTFD